MGQQELCQQTAARLETLIEPAGRLKAFVGLDGFVDEIIHVVGKRDHAESFQRLTTIKSLGDRILGAAGKSTNIELVNQRTKLGGNGPIMANALAALGLKVTYVGALGYPAVHPVFNELAQRAQVHSIAEPGHTDALEFDDGKLMLGKTAQFNDINWANVQGRYGREKFIAQMAESDLVAFVNWTMIPYMSEIWEGVLEALPAPDYKSVLHTIFFDLADPEKRTPKDITRALELIGRFGDHFAVVLGLNEKESTEVGKVLGLNTNNHSPEGLSTLAKEIQARLDVDTLVLHPVASAIAVSEGTLAVVDGPFTDKPLITTGAGDHFNAGFALGKLLGFENAASLLVGVTASGYYVRTGQSPAMGDLVNLLRNWPK
jgi:hypothetical protein